MIEPKYPGAFEQLVDLSVCWNEHLLFLAREEIMTLATKIGRCHEHCCRFLGAAGSLGGDTYRIALDATDSAKVARASERIAAVEFRGGKGQRGQESVRFLSCVTNKGLTLFEDTAKELSERIYLIDDAYGAASRLLLASIREHALESGFDIICCYCPLSPFEKLEHIFIPALGLGFMTANDFHRPNVEPYRIIRSRRFTDPEQLSRSRKRIAFNKKAEAQMLQQAARLLSEAKELHDRLEQCYTAAMDFNRVDEVCAKVMQKYEHIMSAYGL